MPTHVVELLLGEHITVTEVDEEFTGSIRTALKGLEHSPLSGLDAKAQARRLE